MLEEHEQLAAYIDEICRRGERPTILFAGRAFSVTSAAVLFDRPGLLCCTLVDGSDLVVPLSTLAGVIVAPRAAEMIG